MNPSFATMMFGLYTTSETRLSIETYAWMSLYPSRNKRPCLSRWKGRTDSRKWSSDCHMGCGMCAFQLINATLEGEIERQRDSQSLCAGIEVSQGGAETSGNQSIQLTLASNGIVCPSSPHKAPTLPARLAISLSVCSTSS